MKVKDFFSIPEQKKVTEKDLHRVLLTSICSILLCISCLAGSTWAWFTASIENKDNTIEIARPGVVLKVDDADYAEGQVLSDAYHKLYIEHGNEADHVAKKSTLYVTITVSYDGNKIRTYTVLNEANHYAVALDIVNAGTASFTIDCDAYWNKTDIGAEFTELTGNVIEIIRAGLVLTVDEKDYFGEELSGANHMLGIAYYNELETVQKEDVRYAVVTVNYGEEKIQVYTVLNEENHYAVDIKIVNEGEVSFTIDCAMFSDKADIDEAIGELTDNTIVIPFKAPESTTPEETTPEETEPEATEPEATEPEATEPEATEPEATEPEATEPEATEPEATEPEATEPVATEPVATEPEGEDNGDETGNT